MDTVYPLAANTFTDREIDAAVAVLRSGRMTMGEKVEAFEAAFARWIDCPFAVMVNSGSSANLLMIEAMLRRTAGQENWQSGDEVLVPALSWPTTVWPVVQLGLVPVFVDMDPDTMALDLDSAKSAIGPRTRGMFLIHVLGRAADLDRYKKFADAHGLDLLEDACESLGAHSGGSHVGTVGVMGSFSFYFSHHLSTVEGGMVVTSDAGIFDDLKGMRSHGWVRDRSDRKSWVSAAPDIDERFLFATTGYNLRPTDIQAAIGLVQLDRLHEMLHSRADLARQVASWVQECAPWMRLIGTTEFDGQPIPGRSWLPHSWMTLPFEILKGAPAHVGRVTGLLESFGIETRPIIAGNLVRHPAIKNINYRQAPSLEVSDRILDNGFMIGCHPFASSQQQHSLEQAFRGLAKL